MSKQSDDLKKFALERGVIDESTAEQMEKAKLPTVTVPGGRITISDSARSLYGHIAASDELYLRDGNVCQLVDDRGTLKLDILKPAAACSRFEDFVHFAQLKIKDGKEVLESTVISKELAEKYLATGARDLLKPVEGLLRCPLITERHGKLHIVHSGYDPLTKLIITENVPLTEVPIEEAVEIIKDIHQDFLFQTPGDRSRALASFITPALKFGGFIRGPIPADAAEADKSQAGKSYRHQMIAAAYNDTCAVVTKPESAGVGGLEEGFSTALIEGRPFIQFDNVRGKFNLQGLEAFMTATGTFPARAAYTKVTQVEPHNHMIMISSNGYQTTPDLANRSSIIRIYKREGYEFKAWAPQGEYKGGMREFIQDAQPYVLSCIFSVVREWHRLGKKRTKDARHDFREWCQILDWIVQHIFKEAPLMDGHKEAQARVSNPDHGFIRQMAMELEVRQKLGEPLRPSELATICIEASIYIPGVAPDRRHEQQDANTGLGKTLKRVMGESDSATVDVFLIEKKMEKVISGVSNTYPGGFFTFTKAAESDSARTAGG